MKLKSSIGTGIVDTIRVYSEVACEMKIHVFANPSKLQPVCHTSKLTGNEVCYRTDGDLLINISPYSWSPTDDDKFCYKHRTRLEGDHFMVYVVTDKTEVHLGVLESNIVRDRILLEMGPCVFKVSQLLRPQTEPLLQKFYKPAPLSVYNHWAQQNKRPVLDDDINWLERHHSLSKKEFPPSHTLAWGVSPKSDLSDWN